MGSLSNCIYCKLNFKCHVINFNQKFAIVHRGSPFVLIQIALLKNIKYNYAFNISENLILLSMHLDAIEMVQHFLRGWACHCLHYTARSVRALEDHGPLTTSPRAPAHVTLRQLYSLASIYCKYTSHKNTTDCFISYTMKYQWRYGPLKIFIFTNII